MVRQKESSEENIRSSIDVFEALKRALIKRGFFRQKPARKIHRPPAAQGSTDKLISAAVKSHDILFKANTVFPFTLFPDTVTLDREKLSFATRYFFYVANVTSVPVRDLLSVEANVGPFFGSLQTSSRYFITSPKKISFLWREDAIKLERLLQGYIIAHEQKIDCESIETAKLKRLLNDLGKPHTG